ncbi:hypothetical protein OIU91_06345 [Streptomyces sp. NBC_01456]|uniref:hypothetical protein n=1 Tax=Streptomyces sp. NBC_01456 TaxID=2975868 RepID=UPI002E363699|nr:hypothetical protein [Streptomyces sp. NBC_01456]
MTVISTIRHIARHRGESTLQIRIVNARLEQQVEELTGQLIRLAGEAELLDMQMDEAAIDYSCALDDLRIVREENARLAAAVTAWEARYANDHPVSVPAPRDLRELDERPTGPIAVVELRHRFQHAGRVVHVTGRPFAA